MTFTFPFVPASNFGAVGPALAAPNSSKYFFTSRTALRSSRMDWVSAVVASAASPLTMPFSSISCGGTLPFSMRLPLEPVTAVASIGGVKWNSPRKPGMLVETDAIGLAPLSTSRMYTPGVL